MKKNILIIGLVLAVLVALFYVFNTYIYNEKQGDGSAVEPYRATLSGTRVCLPHKDPAEPATKECALGIKTDVGEYYALDFNAMSQTLPDIKDGQKFTASGVITPIEYVSTDQWQKYEVVGIFSVTDSVVVDDKAVDAVPTPTPKKCFVGGCSSQLCSDTPNMVSTCEYTDAYACYKTATCEVQSDGACGWTKTPELRACLVAPPITQGT